MNRRSILLEDVNDHGVYHEITPDFFSAPISCCAKGVYLVLTSLGNSKKHTLTELCSMSSDSVEDVINSLDELDHAGFDTSNLIRA